MFNINKSPGECIIKCSITICMAQPLVDQCKLYTSPTSITPTRTHEEQDILALENIEMEI